MEQQLISVLLKYERSRRGLSLLKAARQMNIHSSTLCRIERDQGKPDSETFFAIANWLNIPVAGLLRDLPLKNDKPLPIAYFEDATTIEKIRATLIADRSLSIDSVDALTSLMQGAYNRVLGDSNAKHIHKDRRDKVRPS